MSYKNKTHKLKELWNKTNNNNNSIDKLKKINIRKSSILGNKLLGKTEIMNNYLLPPLGPTIEFEIDLKGVSTWFLPYIKLTPIFYTEEGIDWLETDFTPQGDEETEHYYEFVYYIRDISSSLESPHYVLRGQILAYYEYEIDDEDVYYPLYVDLNIYINNRRFFCEIQTKRT